MSTICRFSLINVKEFLHFSHLGVGKGSKKAQKLVNAVYERLLIAKPDSSYLVLSFLR